MSKGIFAAALLATVGMAGAARAALVTFEVDPARSVISLGPLINIGDTLEDDLNQAVAQPGGESASYSGTFDVDIVGDTINFPSGDQTIIASTSATGLMPGGGPGNYGIVTLHPAGAKTAALRDFQFNFLRFGSPFTIAADGSLLDPDRDNDPGVPELDATWMLSNVFGEDFDSNILGNFGVPPRADPATLTTEDGIMTLEIPVFTFITWSESGAGDSQFQLIGTIVATSGVPEPGALSALGLAGTVLLARRRRG